MNKLNFVLGAKKILSVNAIYSSKILYKAGRPISTIYKSGEAKQVEDYIKEQVRLLDIQKNYPWVTKDTLFRLTITVVFKSGILLRDLDNSIKLLQDGIFRALDINDSHVVEIFARKRLCPDLSEEKICITLTEIKDKASLNFEYFPKPETVWCDHELENFKELPKRKSKGEIYKVNSKDDSNTEIYILDPSEKITYNTFGDIRENLIDLVPKGKLGYVFILGNETIWGSLWEDVENFKEIINGYSKSYKGIQVRVVNSKEDIYKILKDEGG